MQNLDEKLFAFLGGDYGVGTSFIAKKVADKLGKSGKTILINMSDQIEESYLGACSMDNLSKEYLHYMDTKNPDYNSRGVILEGIIDNGNYEYLPGFSKFSHRANADKNLYWWIIESLWKEYDFLVIDLGANIHDENVNTFIKNRGCFIVMDSSWKTVARAKEKLNTLKKRGCNIKGIMVNDFTRYGLKMKTDMLMSALSMDEAGLQWGVGKWKDIIAFNEKIPERRELWNQILRPINRFYSCAREWKMKLQKAGAVAVSSFKKELWSGKNVQ